MRITPLLLLLASAAAGAQDTTAPPDAASPGARPLWEVGVFGVGGSQQAYPGSRQQVSPALVLPFVVYRGPILRAGESGVGIRALKTPTVELDIGLSGSFGSSAGDEDARRGMPRIGTLGELGPQLKVKLGEGFGGRWSLALPLRGVFDVSHSFDSRGLAFEPSLAWGNADGQAWSYGASLSLLVGNARLNNTFYGVTPEFANASRPVYGARAGLIATRLAVGLGKRVAADWYFFAYARAQTVAGAANRSSPLVDRTTGASAGVGLAWTWLRSERAGAE